MSSAQEFERGVGRRGVDELGVREYAAQGQGRGMTAPDREANARPIRIGSPLKRRTRRHEKGVVQLENGRREVYTSPRRVGPHKPHVTRAGRKARQHLRNSR